jgi:3-oxoacyl-[acyl-carrier protein] reductase
MAMDFRIQTDLSGRKAVVTGGAQGIGRGIAEAFARSGAAVTIVDLREAQMAATKAELAEAGLTVSTAVCDVSDYQSVLDARDKIEGDNEGIDILVNSAGIVHTTPFEELTPEAWRKLLAVNLDGVFYWCKAVVPGMKSRRRGRIITLSSLAGRMGGISVSADYAVSKAGVIVLTMSLAKELAPYGVTANCIAPGLAATAMQGAFSEEGFKKIVDNIPVGRVAEPREIAELALYLASDAAGYITGETVNINGGQRMD